MSNSEGDPARNPDLEPDPIFTDGLREGKHILLMWVACLIWTLAVCLTKGYPDTIDPETFPTVFGIPAWVAWGIALPWLIADVVTIAYCMGYMRDGDLGEEPEVSSDTDGGSHV